MLRDGRRQIVKVHIRGDMLGFPSLALAQAGETLEALSDVAVAHIPNAAIGAMFEEAPRVAAAMFLSSQRERVALMHSLSWLGATSAFERLVAFIIDLHRRLDAAGLVTNGTLDFPLRQQHIAELLGITPVHTNRVLRRLDHTGYVERSRETITIADLQGLQSLAANRMPASGGSEAWFRLKPA